MGGTNGFYSALKPVRACILLVNDQLIECATLRQAVKAVYSDTLTVWDRHCVYLTLDLYRRW